MGQVSVQRWSSVISTCCLKLLKLLFSFSDGQSTLWATQIYMQMNTANCPWIYKTPMGKLELVCNVHLLMFSPSNSALQMHINHSHESSHHPTQKHIWQQLETMANLVLKLTIIHTTLLMSSMIMLSKTKFQPSSSLLMVCVGSFYYIHAIFYNLHMSLDWHHQTIREFQIITTLVDKYSSERHKEAIITEISSARTSAC